MRRVIVLAVVVAAAVAGLGFTKQGRAVLAQFGLAKACTEGGCGD